MSLNMRDDWIIEGSSLDSSYYNKEETVSNVKENFDFRRYYSAEGYDLEINGVHERCLVQMPNNPLRELNDYRKIHCPMTADVRRGYYVKYEDCVWIIDTNVASVDDAYVSTRMSRCNYLLRWQNDEGKIVSRWGYSEDQTKYSTGETGTEQIRVGDNQYGLLIPIDDETKLLKRGMRFCMDFEDSPAPDVYTLSNRKVKLNDETSFGRGGTIDLTLTLDVFNAQKDKKVTLESGEQVWICNYIPSNEHIIPEEASRYAISIVGPSWLKAGIPKTYQVLFMDETNKKFLPDDFTWIAKADSELKTSISGDSITIEADGSTVGEHITLQVIYRGLIAAQTTIAVIEAI